MELKYPAHVGRNVEEILRIVDSLEVVSVDRRLGTPENYKKGDDVFILRDVSEEEANRDFKGYENITVPSKKNYMRKVNLDKVQKM
jgi:uncharacterized protein (DUF2147 family)